MNEELTLAIEQLRQHPRNCSWFIPVRFSGDIPDWSIGAGKTLKDIHRVDLDEVNWDQNISQILKVIKKKDRIWQPN
jgi:hypothetical protein